MARRTVVQEHHIRYPNDPRGEWKVIVYKGEHFVLTRLQWRRRISKGFIEALENFIAENKPFAVTLKKETK
jgi:hypothetical protein